MKSKQLDWGGDKDGDKRGAAFCIVCAWFLRLLMRGTERHQHQLPGFCVPTQTPVPFCLPETLLCTPPVRRHLGWVVGDGTPRKTKSSFWFCWFLSISEKKTKPPLPSGEVREDKRFSDVF